MQHLLAVGQYVQTHVPGILAAILVTYVIGFAWHGPLFGKQWMALNGLKPPAKDAMKFSLMLPGLSANFVMVFVQSAVLGRTLQILQLNGIGDALIIAVILWLPFTALTIVNSYAWLGKSWKLMLLDSAFTLASLLAVAAVLYGTL